ncbi:hypothetical protein SAMCCGM7_pB0237 (plasmid) [Sinorhizobium americanum CCGM7]|nr:hypothetical protein SAMCCGM7_pB0237 [Sinorhizobium americanum CCGM7]
MPLLIRQGTREKISTKDVLYPVGVLTGQHEAGLALGISYMGRLPLHHTGGFLIGSRSICR